LSPRRLKVEAWRRFWPKRATSLSGTLIWLMVDRPSLTQR
jgi:hypothetical protein